MNLPKELPRVGQPYLVRLLITKNDSGNSRWPSMECRFRFFKPVLVLPVSLQVLFWNLKRLWDCNPGSKLVALRWAYHRAQRRCSLRQQNQHSQSQPWCLGVYYHLMQCFFSMFMPGGRLSLLLRSSPIPYPHLMTPYQCHKFCQRVLPSSTSKLSNSLDRFWWQFHDSFALAQ